MAIGVNIYETTGFISKQISDSSIAVGRFATYDTSTNVLEVAKAATANTDVPLGVTTTATDEADKDATIQYQGMAKVQCNGNSVNIAAGDPLTATTAGVGVKVATASATAQWVHGIAQQPCTADGDMIPVMIVQSLYVKGTA